MKITLALKKEYLISCFTLFSVSLLTLNTALGQNIYKNQDQFRNLNFFTLDSSVDKYRKHLKCAEMYPDGRIDSSESNINCENFKVLSDITDTFFIGKINFPSILLSTDSTKKLTLIVFIKTYIEPRQNRLLKEGNSDYKYLIKYLSKYTNKPMEIINTQQNYSKNIIVLKEAAWTMAAAKYHLGLLRYTRNKKGSFYQLELSILKY